MTRELLDRLPEGYTKGVFQTRTYGISKTIFNGGKSCKVFARELGGTDFISLNFYQTHQQDVLKPCEMPEEKVLAFLREVALI